MVQSADHSGVRLGSRCLPEGFTSRTLEGLLEEGVPGSGIQLKADSFDGADCVNIFVIFPLIKACIGFHWKGYWLSVMAHHASLFATRGGVALAGPNNVMSGLWLVTKINELLYGELVKIVQCECDSQCFLLDPAVPALCTCEGL